MSVIDDGVIKYDTSDFTLTPALKSDEFLNLEYWRRIFFQINLIGQYLPEKIGYGNLSLKKDYSKIHSTHNAQFIITGTQTGGSQNLCGESYTRVLDYNFKNWTIKTMGPIQASSEALTHAAIYDSNPKEINTVFHIHSKKIWKGMIHENYDSTSANIPYGTEEMAIAVRECVSQKSNGIIVMQGHEDGVIAYAESMEIAGKLILDVYERFSK